jgi:hypothetical protein
MAKNRKKSSTLSMTSGWTEFLAAEGGVPWIRVAGGVGGRAAATISMPKAIEPHRRGSQ